MTITTDTNPQLLRRVQHFKRRAKDLSTQVVQLRASRENWRKKALAESAERQVWQRKAKAQFARAELWKHRALHEDPGHRRARRESALDRLRRRR